MVGVVIKSTGSWYVVLDSEGNSIECRIRGKIRLKEVRSTNPVVVGDRVEYEAEGENGVITDILPRDNYIIRRASNLSKESHIIAANIDQALIVVSLKNPKTNYEFIDRFLVTCEGYKIPATIVLNKVDIAPEEEVDEFIETYSMAGYRVILSSVKTGEGIDDIAALLKDKTTLLSGNSGVGKSSLVSTIEPTLDIKIGEVSQSHNKGKHTTTFSQIYPLTFGGFIVDTPGIKGFGLIDIDSRELCRYFPDLMRYAPNCKFYNCTHQHEPDCAVERALIEGKISMKRYESYLKMVEEETKYRQG